MAAANIEEHGEIEAAEVTLAEAEALARAELEETLATDELAEDLVELEVEVMLVELVPLEALMLV